MKMNFGVAGRYRLQAGKPGEPYRLDTGFFDNLILDQGLDQIGTVSNYNQSPGSYLFQAASVGSGTTPPTNADTQLEAWVASASGSSYTTSYVAGPPQYWRCLHTVRFGAGVAAGNLSEVGMGAVLQTPNGSGLFSRALILDASGNPTTITVLSDEILDVTYEFRVYPDSTSIPWSQVINGTTYSGNWDLTDVNTAPNIYQCFQDGASTSSCRLTMASNADGTGSSYAAGFTGNGYAAGSYQRSYSIEVPTGSANWNINYIEIVSRNFKMKTNPTPAIPKTNVQKLAINVTCSWDRYTPP